MFADWTDPYDIDHYYADVGKIFTKVNAYADPPTQIVVPTPVAAPPVAASIATSAVSQLASSTTPTITPTVTAATTPAVKSGFEVVPNSIFLDGHSVGSQPPYNILRSGPPAKDTYINRYAELTGGQDNYAQMYSPGTFSRFDPWTIILWIIIGMLVVQVIKLNIMVCSSQMVLQSLMQNLGKKM